MRIAITQPTYLPWLGYFALMNSCDKFMLLDDVKFVRSSWMNRNRLYDPELGRIRYLTIPVHRRQDEKIIDVTIAEERWKLSHHNMVRHLFRKAPFLEDVMQVMEILFTTRSKLLIDYTLPIIQRIKEILGIKTPVLRSFDFPGHNNFVKTQRLRYLIEAINGSEYLAQPTAVKAYLDLEELRQGNLGVELFQYNHPYYKTGSDHFEPNMSVLELIGWVDPGERIKVLKSGVSMTTLVEPSKRQTE